MFKTTHKIKAWLLSCLMAIVTVLAAVSAFLMPPATNTVSADGTWTLVKNVNDLAVGDQIIIAASASNVALSTTQNGNNRGQTAITKSGDTITAPSSSVQIITLKAGTASGTFAFYTGSGYLYAAGGTSTKNNYLKTQSTLNAAASWTISITSTGVATVKTADSTVVKNWMRYNSSSSLFSCYSTGQADIVIYKPVKADEPECEHTDTEFVYNEGKGTHNEVCTECEWKVAENVACTQKTSYTEGVGTHTKTTTCAVCNGTISTQTATCEYDEDVNPPTVEAGGYTTYTCKYCGYSYDDDFTPALGQTEATVTYNVPVGVAAIEPVTVDINSTVKLPTLESPVGYTFVGWTTTEYATAVETQPEVFTGEYTVAADVEMYALYSKTIAGDNYYKKVTAAPADWSGEYLIVYEKDGTAYIFNGKDEVNGYVEATPVNGTIKPTEDINNVAVTIASMSGGYSIKTAGGYIYGVSGSNTLKFDGTKKLTTIELAEDGSATITSDTSIFRFNSASNQMRFRYYKSGQQAVCLYELVVGTKTVYATLDAVTAISSASITVEDDITVNYYVSLEEQYKGAQMKFTMLGEEYIVDGVQQQDGRYKYSFVDIAPQYMAENIKAELIFNGTLLATVENYSIKQYAINKLVGADAKLQRLLTDLLYYGDEAQKYLGMEATITANVDGLAEKATATPTTTALEIINNPEAQAFPAWFSAAGLKFDNVNQLYVKVAGDLENVTITVKNGDEVVKTVTGGICYTDGIVATQFDTVFTFELSVNGEVLQTLTYSVNSYVFAMQNSANANMVNLANALYNYGVAAKAYKA